MEKRTTHEILSHLEDTGELSQLIKAGYCQPCTVTNLNVFRYVDARMSMGDRKTKAVCDASVAFNIGERHIFRILETFK